MIQDHFALGPLDDVLFHGVLSHEAIDIHLDDVDKQSQNSRNSEGSMKTERETQKQCMQQSASHTQDARVLVVPVTRQCQ